jgi:type I restriction enzyme M protein
MSDQETLARKIVPYLRSLGFGAVRLEQPFGTGSRRFIADAVAYEQDDKPAVLIEIKVSLRDKERQYDLYNPAIRQAYKAALVAETPYFLVTDGETHLWFKIDWVNGTADLIDEPPRSSPVERRRLRPFAASDELDKILFAIADLFRSASRDNAVRTSLLLLHTKITDEQNLKQNQQSLFYALPNEDIASTAERIRALDSQGTRIGLTLSELSTDALVPAIGLLQPYSLLETDSFTLRNSFARLISGYLKGTLGQYVTPSSIVDFMVQMVAPTIGERIIDPACGTGGFLMSIVDYWLASNGGLARNISGNQVVGIDIDPLIAQIAWLNFRLIDDSGQRIYTIDSLDQVQLDKIGFKTGTFDVAIFNPPLGAKIGDEKILDQYEFLSRATATSEALFIVQGLRLLRDGGRLAMIVPEGILSTGRYLAIRKWLLQNAAVDAIVSLPMQAMQPATGIKTSIIFATKASEQRAIFLAEAREIGHDRQGRLTAENDLTQIIEDFRAFKNGETELGNSWIIHPTAEFSDRMDVTFHDLKHSELTRFFESLSIPVLRLEEVAAISRGRLPRSRPRSDSGFPVVSATQIRGAILDLTDAQFISEEAALERDLVDVSEGDLLMPAIRSGNAPAIVERSDLTVALDQTILLIRPTAGVLLSRFLQFLFTTKLIQSQLDQLSTGAVIQRVYPRQLIELRVPVPSLETQKKVIARLDQMDSLRRQADDIEFDIRNRLGELLQL